MFKNWIKPSYYDSRNKTETNVLHMSEERKKKKLPFLPAPWTECFLSSEVQKYFSRPGWFLSSLARHVWDFDLSLEFCLHYGKGPLRQTSLFCAHTNHKYVIRKAFSPMNILGYLHGVFTYYPLIMNTQLSWGSKAESSKKKKNNSIFF